MTTPQLFRCAVYSCRLTRDKCADRHRSAKRPPGTTYGPTLRWSQCASCAIGAAHARGEKPDVELAALVRREEVGVAGKTYTHAGKTLTTTGWAADPDVANLGLTAQAIAGRIDGGWTVEDALTTPKGAPRPATSAPKKSGQRAPRGKPKDPEAAERAAVKAGFEAGQALARVRVTIAGKKPKRPSDVASVVRDALTALSPAELLTRLGYVVEDAGVVPAGRLLLVRGAES